MVSPSSSSSRGSRRPFHQLRDARGHVAQLAREDAHLVARLVELDARAVELVFEDGFAQALERFRRVLRRAGEHGRDRRQQAQREAREAARALLEGGPGHVAQVGREHGGLADVGGRKAGRPCDRLLHEAVQRALPDLTQHQCGQEAALVFARALEQAAQGPGPPLRGAGPALAGQGLERAVHVHKGQRLVPRRRRAFEGGVDGAPAQADAALRERPREVQGEELRLASARRPEHVRDEPDLLRLLRRRAHALDERGQRGEGEPRRRRHPISVSGAAGRGQLQQAAEER
jgi:hypothetical protein